MNDPSRVPAWRVASVHRYDTPYSSGHLTPDPRAVTRFALSLLTLLALAGARPVSGQVNPTVVPSADTVAADSVALGPRVSPLGAFLRAIALPTWGHGSIGSHRRGTFYLLAEGGTAWMLLKTLNRKGSAERVLAARERVVTAQVTLDNPGAEDLDALIEEALEADALVDDARRRLDAREGQVEDWVAMAIFLTFLSGADAFVSAHLRDFPDPIDVSVGPTPDGGVQVAARLRLGAFIR